MSESIPPHAVPKLLPRARIQTDKVSGKPVLVSQETVLVLNPTGADILALCDGQRTFAVIAAELAVQYNAPPETIAAQAASYLLKLRGMNLLNWAE